MDKYYVRGKIDNNLTNLYRIDEKGLIEMYTGKGIWKSDFVGSGNALADISGFGGSWYNMSEIGFDEVNGAIEVLEARYKDMELYAYHPDFNR
ncbi:MAG: hypothetical protein AAGU03_04165 [Anaerolineaceae bacterium]